MKINNKKQICWS